MNQRLTFDRVAQLLVVLLSALMLKQYYSTAGVNHLRWILAPTTAIVELVTGSRFEFESHAGYINSERSFIIAASCAGVNFLITAFLMLSLRKLWLHRSQKLTWNFIPAAALLAYLATIVANTVRISTALQLRRTPLEIDWLSPNQLHRVEGIFVYFGFLLLLFMFGEKLNFGTRGVSGPMSQGSRRQPAWPVHGSGLIWQSFFPLLVYYASTLAIPLVNGVFRQGNAAADLWEHSLFVLLTPLILILMLAAFRLFRWWPRFDSACDP